METCFLFCALSVKRYRASGFSLKGGMEGGEGRGGEGRGGEGRGGEGRGGEGRKEEGRGEGMGKERREGEHICVRMLKGVRCASLQFTNCYLKGD